jgi:hypothetical protein
VKKSINSEFHAESIQDVRMTKMASFFQHDFLISFYLFLTRCDFVASGLGMQKTLQYFLRQKRDFLSRFSGFLYLGWRFLGIVAKKLTEVFWPTNNAIFSALVADGGNVCCQSSDRFFCQNSEILSKF